MSEIWTFLSGEVPGGFTVPLVLILVYFPVLEYVYRTGETMKERTYRRVRWMGPALVIAVYALVWIQAPPRTVPKRIAVITSGTQTGSAHDTVSAIAELAGRSLRQALPHAIINPWSESLGEYDQPTRDVLRRSGYRVYQLTSAGDDAAGVTITITKNGDPLDDIRLSAQLYDDLDRLCQVILSDLGVRAGRTYPFGEQISQECADFYFSGLLQLREKRVNNARQYFERAFTQDTTFVAARLRAAQCLEMAGEREAASAVFIAAMQANPSSYDVLLLAGEHFIRTFGWEKAEPALKLALTSDPSQPRSYLALSKLHEERLRDLRMDNKIALLEEAVRLDPAFEEARAELAGYLLKTTVAYKASSFLKEGLELNPTSVTLLLKMGAVELYDGNLTGAEAYYRKILEVDAENATAAFNLGVVAYRGGDYAQAEQHFRQCLGWGGSIDAYYYLGMLFQKLGEDEKAGQFFMKRWELRSSDEDVFAVKAYQLARQLAQSGEEQP